MDIIYVNPLKLCMEIKSLIQGGDIIVAEGLKKVRPRGKIKPIKK